MNKNDRITSAIFTVFCISSLIVPAFIAALPAPESQHPPLADSFTGSTQETIRVIVYRAGPGDDAESAILSAGGSVLTDLKLINAFAAKIPARTMAGLSAHGAIAGIALDAPVLSAGGPGNGNGNGNGGGQGNGNGNGNQTDEPIPENFFLDTLGVRPVWDMGFTGSGISIAIIDSGVFLAKDLQVDPTTGQPTSRVIVRESFNPDSLTVKDFYGHGTHVAGIAAGSGYLSEGAYAGVAPGANLIGLKISDENGMAYESDTVNALQWVYDHKDLYNIRVVNLSIQSTMEQSYHESALDAAAEILWFNGVVVVASSGNKGHGGDFDTVRAAPANDPFIITVGASIERDTPNRSDDAVAPFTASGYTLDGDWKPEIIAPGQDIVSLISPDSDWKNEYPERVVSGHDYFRLSGTSMAAPMVSGAAALLLQAEPNLTPDQVKARFIQSSSWIGAHHYLNIRAALTSPTTNAANQDQMPHILLAKMAMIAYWSSQNGEENIDWASVDWDTVNWNAVNWNAVNWNAVNWNAVNWNAVNWNAVNWNAVNWNAVNWNAVNWNAVNWKD